MAAKRSVPALRFTQGGAPLSFSYLAGFMAPFHPEYPTPLSDLHITEQLAELFSSDPGCPVELTFITERQADEFRSLAANHRTSQE